MTRPRVIPALLMKNGGLYKTQRFARPAYVGDPINAMRVFNDKEVDEIVLLDIGATRGRRGPDFARLQAIAAESFMPLAYGGGIQRYDDAMKLFSLGVEKVILNTAAFRQPSLVTKIAKAAGSQSVVVSIDVRDTWLSGPRVFIEGGRKNTGLGPVEYAKKAEALGAGEIMLTAIAREGTLTGYDLPLVRAVAEAASIPVIAHGGAATLHDFAQAVNAGASAVAAGSLFVFNGPHRAVLISYPSPAEIDSLAGDNP